MTGFLPIRDPIERTSFDFFKQFEEFSSLLPAHIAGGRVKESISLLPELNQHQLNQFLISEDVLERGALVYGFLAHAYLNGECGTNLISLSISDK